MPLFTALALDGSTPTTMDATIKEAIVSACQQVVDVSKDGIVAVLPIGLSLMAITWGIRKALGFFKSVA